MSTQSQAAVLNNDYVSDVPSAHLSPECSTAHVSADPTSERQFGNRVRAASCGLSTAISFERFMCEM
jgi:hypothetical protein